MAGAAPWARPAEGRAPHSPRGYATTSFHRRLRRSPRRDRSFSYGLEALFDSVPVRGSNAKVSGSTRGLGASDFVLKVMHLGGADMTATLSAAASRGDVTILSRPVVLAANNESAEILVGSQRPFIQVQRALPTDNAARDQVVQFKDVGTRLTVRPTISDDGYVTL